MIHANVISRIGLSLKKLKTYEALIECGPCTSKELQLWISKKTTNIEDLVSAQKRLSELEKLGIAKITGKKICEVTGRNVKCWSAVIGIEAFKLPRDIK